jgi:hypothetical protein
MADREHLVRALWTLFEPIHAVSYFAPQAREHFGAVGLTRYWDGYFAGRAAPLGAVTAAPVIAIFGGFSPFLVERTLPGAWSIASPETALEARAAGAAATLRDVFADEDAIAIAADALTRAATVAATVGRPLAAANQALPVDSDPYRRLWQATATLREHRGDGHVIAQVTEGIGGLSAIVLRSAMDIEAETMKRARGWTEDQWASEVESLAARGMLERDGSITDAGIEALGRTETLTNRLALDPWSELDDQGVVHTARLVAPVAVACASMFPYPNPIGMPHAWDPFADPEAAQVPGAPVHRSPRPSR